MFLRILATKKGAVEWGSLEDYLRKGIAVLPRQEAGKAAVSRQQVYVDTELLRIDQSLN